MTELRVLTVVGARPQFIKAAPVSRAIAARDGIKEILVHTGQHFDPGMSQIFFDKLGSNRRGSIWVFMAAATAR